MITKVHHQKSIVENYFQHDHVEELKVIDELIFQNRQIIKLIHNDLIENIENLKKGRKAILSAEQVFKILLIKQMNGFSYEILSFHLADSRTYRAFSGFSFAEQKLPSKSTLQRYISKIKPKTLEKINRLILQYAKKLKIEDGRKARVDCTVVESNIHKPYDSESLWDCIRTICRIGKRLGKKYGFKITDHRRVGKKVRRQIFGIKGKKKRNRLYRKLCKITRKVVDDAEMALEDLNYEKRDEKLIADFVVYCLLAKKVLHQTESRLLRGEKVPAKEKIYSIFELHTDMIIKARRGIEYGHKNSLSCGISGMILDLVIENGNPADSKLATRMADRLKEIYGKFPRDIAFDGGFASKQNLQELKSRGIKNACFHKKCNLKIKEMVKSLWVYKRLKKFRAGIEGIISFLKRCFGLTRCTWKGLEHFHSYVWSSIVTANTLIFARRIIARRKKE